MLVEDLWRTQRQKKKKNTNKANIEVMDQDRPVRAVSCETDN